MASATARMKLRLYHHADGARIAYREAGTGPPLVLLHSAGLSHREFEPLVEELRDRYRLVLPDLPLHGDSEDRPHHPYTPQWLDGVLAGFLRETGGSRPIVGGHGLGAQLAVRAGAQGAAQPGALVLLPSALHGRACTLRRERSIQRLARVGAVPGLRALASAGVRAAYRPATGVALSATANPAARDLLRHALGGLPHNGNRARGWARAARHWPAAPDPDLLDAYRSIACPVLLLWSDGPGFPLRLAEEAADVLPDARVRVLDGTGFLLAYDDPVGMAREIAAFRPV